MSKLALWLSSTKFSRTSQRLERNRLLTVVSTVLLAIVGALLAAAPAQAEPKANALAPVHFRTAATKGAATSIGQEYAASRADTARGRDKKLSFA